MDEQELPSVVPFLNVAIEENNVEQGAAKILREIRSGWPLDRVKFKLLTDGITNKLVACKLEGTEDEDIVLVRVYGNKTDLLIDRKAETRNIILLNRVGLAPDLYASFHNGLAYKYVPGRTLTCDSVIQPKVYRLVAKRMAQLHQVRIEGDSGAKPILWDKLRKFIDLIPDVFTNSETQKRFEKSIMSKAQIEAEVRALRGILEHIGSPTVFAHNDLLLGNVIYTEKDQSVCFIDYEYAAFNYQAFDIGNHFAEFAGLDEVDYSRYPNKILQLDWLKTYLTEYKNAEPSENDIETLYMQVNKFVLVSHIFWGVWALIQAEHSYINFDYISYAATRFNEYFSKKSACSSL